MSSAPVVQPASAPLEDDSPVRALAASGGAALLLGLICLAIYAIEQDWLSPGMRFGGSLLLSAALTLAAWPIARRGHEPVAGAIGGAGLGAWMASWLVARHVHELASGGQVFIALAAGAAACLLIADRLRLRLMALLACVAACATPVLVTAGRGSLTELMIYQLVVVAVLMLVDWRRRWPELPTLALMATWLLGGRWAAEGVSASEGGVFMAWTCVVLVASAVSTWRSLVASVDAIERGHARARLLVGGLVTWAGAAWAFAGFDATLALATLGLGLWHTGLAFVLHHRAQVEAGGGAEAAQTQDHFATGLLGLAWLQMMVAGALMFQDATLVWWWIGMSMGAAAFAYKAASAPLWRVIGQLRTAMVLAPAMAAVVYCVDAQHEVWAWGLALAAAAVPLLASLVLRAEPESGVASDAGEASAPHPLLAGLTTVLWAGMGLGFELEPAMSQLLVGLVPVAVLGVWACVRPSKAALTLATVEVALGSFGLLVLMAETHALNPFEGAQDNAWPLALIAVALAVLAAGLVARTRQVQRVDPSRAEFDLMGLGLLTAVSFGFGLALASSAVVAGLDASPAMARLGHTLAIALAGLGLLSAGLAAREDSWRQLGLAAICVAAGKIIFFDLAGAAFVWRALSFAGIGVVLIAGAFLYSRAQKQLQRA